MKDKKRRVYTVSIPKHKLILLWQHINGCLRVREKGRKGLPKRKKGNFWDNGYVHYFWLWGQFQGCIHMAKLTKLYTYQIVCSLMYVSYTLIIKPFKRAKVFVQMKSHSQAQYVTWRKKELLWLNMWAFSSYCSP